MDYPKSVPNVGLVNGKFVDENTSTGVVGSLIPSAWGNGVTDEILAVILAAGIVPSEADHTQLLAALKGRLIGVQVITTSGVYTPTLGTKSVVVELSGGSGSSGATAATGASTIAQSGGGGGGAYAKSRYTAGFAGLMVTIGQGGVAPAAGNNIGLVGGTTSFGGLMSAPGGMGGASGPATAPVGVTLSNGIGVSPTGANIFGKAGDPASAAFVYGDLTSLSSRGGSSPFGTGGHQPSGSGGRPGDGYGAGPSGIYARFSTAAQPGVAGNQGVAIIWEYA